MRAVFKSVEHTCSIPETVQNRTGRKKQMYMSIRHEHVGMEAVMMSQNPNPFPAPTMISHCQDKVLSSTAAPDRSVERAEISHQ